MAWIKMNTGLLENPRVEAIADATGLDTYATAGRLLKLWVWVDANSEDGVGVMTTDERIDKRVECDGFAAAMRLVGWLSGDAHSVTFVRFTEHNGATAKRRAQSAQRNAKYRENGDSEQISQCIESGDAPVTLGASPREEKRREEKKREEEESSSSGGKSCKWTPESGFTVSDQQRQAWADAFPDLDVDREIRKAHAWYLANPTKRKKSHQRFLHGWLSRSKPTPDAQPERSLLERCRTPFAGMQTGGAR